MSIKNITAGEKIAKAKAMRQIESPKKGTPGIEVAFEFEEPSTGNIERMYWQQWITEKTSERVMDTLVNVLGFNWSEETDANHVYTDPNVLDFERQVKLVVDSEVGEDGKTYMKIKWVNSLGGASHSKATVETRGKLAVAGFNRATYLAMKQQTPAAAAQPPKSDVPF